MKKMFAFVIICCFYECVAAQAVLQKDSLKQVYLSEKNDSVKIWKHIQYINSLLYDYEKQKETATEIEVLKRETDKSNSAEFIFWTLYFDGLCQYNNDNYLNSIIAIEKMNRLVAGNKVSERAKKSAASALITLGLNYSKINEMESAQSSYQRAVRELKIFNDSSNIVLSYLNTGFLFIKTQDYVSAMQVFENGLLYMNESTNENYAVPLYASLSAVASKLGDRKNAAAYLLKAAALQKNFSSVVADAFYDQARGEYELLNKNYTASINAFSAAINAGRRWGDSSFVAESFELLGRAYWQSGNSKLALMQLEYSRTLSVKNNISDQGKIVLKTLFDLYKSEGQYADATTTAASLLLLNDSLTTKQNNNRRIIANALFESEQNAEQISTLQQQNELAKLQLKQKSIFNYILLGSAFFILLIALLSVGNYRQKQQLQLQRIAELENEKQLLAAEAMLQGQEEERNRLSKDLHDGLGGMLSGIKYSFSNMKDNLIMTPENMQGFERGLDMLDSSISELRRVAHSMMPEALMKFGLSAALKDFCASINNSGVLKVIYQSHDADNLDISPTASVTIYRIVQELLNNSIKHAAATQVLVQLNKEDNKLLLTVEDNGKGFDIASLQYAKGIGWMNINNRLDYLKGKLDIQSAPGKGTSVNIEIAIEQ